MSTTVAAPEKPSVTDATSLLPKKLVRARSLFDPEIVRRATAQSFVKLNPVTLAKNPVMFVVEVGAAVTTIFLVRDIFIGAAGIGFQLQIAIWLWFTVVFANFAEAMAEARGKAQADSLRKTKTDSMAKRIASGNNIEIVPASNPKDRLMFRRVRACSTSNPSTALWIQAMSIFLLSISSSRCNAGFRKTFVVEELDRSSRSVSRL